MAGSPTRSKKARSWRIWTQNCAISEKEQLWPTQTSFSISHCSNYVEFSWLQSHKIPAWSDGSNYSKYPRSSTICESFYHKKTQLRFFFVPGWHSKYLWLSIFLLELASMSSSTSPQNLSYSEGSARVPRGLPCAPRVLNCASRALSCPQRALSCTLMDLPFRASHS